MSANYFQVYQLLPKTNCKECGYKTCMAFAVALVSRDVKSEDCPYLSENTLATLKEWFPPVEKEKTGLVVNDEDCTGCNICVVVCEVNAEDTEVFAGKGPRSDYDAVLRVDDGAIKLANPDRCKRISDVEEESLCRACVDYCPMDAIELL